MTHSPDTTPSTSEDTTILGEGGETGSWQPIETAPKDGTHILVVNSAFLHEGEMAVAYWKTQRWEKPEDGHWDVTGYGGYTAEPEIEPTHWTSLPTPPSIEPPVSEGEK